MKLPPGVTPDFIREAVAADLECGRFDRVKTRFPPEPNAYLHIGHAKAIWIDYGVARDFGGTFNLRFDDTNPVKEEQEFVDAIVEDMRWLLSAGGGWDPNVWDGSALFASDYFGRMYDHAVELIKAGKAYVCDLSPEETRSYRGTLSQPGTDSPYRSRSVAENLDLFAKMRAGEFPDGSKSLRAKIDMTSPNIVMRDPVMYRIRHVHHHRQGADWCIYPSYDWAHGLEDSYEGVTHSLCTLEYEIHRPLYDWFLVQLGAFHSRQIEFSRLNLTHTVMSKRKFVELVADGIVTGYDDPRMPTIAGLRRRGYSAEAIRNFCERIGVTKSATNMEMYQLEDALREDLNKRASRRMAVLDPIKVIVTNMAEGEEVIVQATNNPEDPEAGTRPVRFTRELFIERDDFREVPPPKYHRLSPGTEVRLRYSYVLKCDEVVKSANGHPIELRCTIDKSTLGANPADGRKIKAAIHWVSAEHAQPAEILLYDHLFSEPAPDSHEGRDYREFVNPASRETRSALLEPDLDASPGTTYQFERLGYFCADKSSEAGKPVFNRTVTLRDTWAKIVAKD